MTEKQIADLLYILKIGVEKYDQYLRILAKINNLPPPTPLPTDWDQLLKEPSEPPDGDD